MLYTPEALAKAHYVPPYSAVIATVALVVALLAFVSSVFLQPYIARRFQEHHNRKKTHLWVRVSRATYVEICDKLSAAGRDGGMDYQDGELILFMDGIALVEERKP